MCNLDSNIDINFRAVSIYLKGARFKIEFFLSTIQSKLQILFIILFTRKLIINIYFGMSIFENHYKYK